CESDTNRSPSMLLTDLLHGNTQPGFSACTHSQLINSIDILRARRATGLMIRDNYRTVNNITLGKHPEAKR
ncbi:TA system toxin CbtA family protein, partial [Escherichia coli]